ncbi:acetyl-coa acetyltransferase hydroxymethylglutaryl-coa reductase [Amylolactobacillus amylotrophicus DSM 20534]|uniref:3-hydroxy-3-methylglutaryl coenzyme A reductase n=3 Tax=Amylolactobacillus TaxID=2767876 RepID=A0A0R1YJI1_9LACO|nr:MULTISPECIES: hydroxymethylglutaryl-CoA reductase, degradative [Amylolactobacillus]APT18890.1 hydroxymethylglutaryl-CoA reductase, degradative [Amylolactobacillus amylophilus DSM 20533 = JCM 1125]KRK38854.1 acetyl-coa acetyltransferase hydroxymethylglutaryl-coa reductase [Amylolactobacillus amylotrophicus DSM 20534]KRM42503.1 acetyl-coa acetyltransferase hydroxymethylglutaryl-coa reductase [Amylolactobacillus amylophilus DSM 20533 = JCM 1125]GED80077.1 hydroxymethylglutaryl-CoA reductase [Am
MTTKKFYQLSPAERREQLYKKNKLRSKIIENTDLAALNQLSENVIGSLSLPLSVVESLIVNDVEYSVPMATEEPSVVAAANHGASIFNRAGGVIATSERQGIYGQVVLAVSPEFKEKHFSQLVAEIKTLIEQLNQQFVSLVNHGGGVRSITAQMIEGLLELKVLVDPAEAMGANKVNSIMEYLTNLLLDYDEIVDAQFAILSNFPTQLTTAKVWLPLNLLNKGCTDAELDEAPSENARKVAQKFVSIADFGRKSLLRAPTNNKGIMNGVDSVLLATGNDFRAVEAATHVYASEYGHYEPLSSWSVESNRKVDFLVGQLTLPLPIGVVGGSINVRPDVKEAFNILGQPNVHELAEVVASIGLANNFAALYALATSGIQEGHMKLQARNAAVSNGALIEELPEILPLILVGKDFSSAKIKQIITEYRNK